MWINGDLLTPANLNNKGGIGEFNVLYYGAAADGITDDSTAVQAAITAAEAADGTVIVPVGTYLINTALTSTGQIRIIGAGRYLTTFIVPVGNRFLNIIAASEIVLQGFGVDGQATTADWNSGSSLISGPTAGDAQVEKVILDDLYIRDCTRQGITFFGGAKYLWLTNSHIEECGRGGIVLQQCQNVIVTTNIFGRTGDNCLAINRNKTSNVIVANNVFDHVGIDPDDGNDSPAVTVQATWCLFANNTVSGSLGGFKFKGDPDYEDDAREYGVASKCIMTGNVISRLGTNTNGATGAYSCILFDSGDEIHLTNNIFDAWGEDGASGQALAIESAGRIWSSGNSYRARTGQCIRKTEGALGALYSDNDSFFSMSNPTAGNAQSDSACSWSGGSAGRVEFRNSRYYGAAATFLRLSGTFSGFKELVFDGFKYYDDGVVVGYLDGTLTAATSPSTLTLAEDAANVYWKDGLLTILVANADLAIRSKRNNISETGITVDVQGERLDTSLDVTFTAPLVNNWDDNGILYAVNNYTDRYLLATGSKTVDSVVIRNVDITTADAEQGTALDGTGLIHNAASVTLCRVEPRWVGTGAPPRLNTSNATPSVRWSHQYSANAAAPTTITNLDDAHDGRVVTILGGANLTIDFTANANMIGNGGSDLTLAAGVAMRCERINSVWYCTVMQ